MQAIDEYNNYFPVDIEICCKIDHSTYYNHYVHTFWIALHFTEIVIITYYIFELRYVILIIN